METSERVVAAFFIGVCALLFFIVVAYSYPSMLGGLGQPSKVVGDLTVQGKVFLPSGSGLIQWPDGLYGNCVVLVTYSTCLQTSTNPPYSPFFIVLSIVAVFFAVIILLALVRRAHEA